MHRLLWNTRLSLDGLKSAQFELGAMRWGIRCGNGGFFSFTGLFYNHKLGFHRAFVTNHIRTVVLRFAKRTVVVSPADPEVFVRDLAACRSRREEAQTEIGKQKTEMGQSVVAPAAQKEKLFIGLATVFFIVMIPTLLGIALAYPRQDTAPILVMAMCVAGLVVCGLRLAGLWPFPSLRFPGPNFSSRNLSRPPAGSRGGAAQTEKSEIGKQKSEIAPRFSLPAIVGACLPLLTFMPAMIFMPLLALSGKHSEPASCHLAGKTELFDLEKDPGELTNVADQNPEVVKDLDARLMAYAKQQKMSLWLKSQVDFLGFQGQTTSPNTASTVGCRTEKPILPKD